MGNFIASGELSKALRPHFTNIKYAHLIQDAPTTEKLGSGGCLREGIRYYIHILA